jgi:hypothetical protein
MSCDRYSAAIVDHACGAELTGDAAAHLQSCVHCRSLFDQQRRSIGAMDRELQEMLAIEPSPQFAPRVRAAVASAPAAAPRLRWIWWSGAVAAAAAVIVFASRPPIEPAARPSPTVAAHIPAPIESAPRVEASTRQAQAPPTRNQPPRLTRTRHSQPPAAEVIVPSGQMQAVERYVALVRSGQLDTSALASTATADSDLVVTPIAVKPIAVDPLEPGTTDGRQGGIND